MLYVCFECDSVMTVHNGNGGAINCGSCGGAYEVFPKARRKPQEGAIKAGMQVETPDGVTYRVWQAKEGLKAISEPGGYVTDLAGDMCVIERGEGK